MDPTPDLIDLLSELSIAQVRFLVVGGYAVAQHAEPRYTKDLDVWVEPTPENAERVMDALRRFRAPLANVSAEDFARPDVVYQIGIDPNRVDILTSIAGVTFERAWPRRLRVEIGKVTCYVLGKNDLIRNKRAVGRPQDLLDLRALLPSAKKSRSKTRRTRRGKQ